MLEFSLGLSWTRARSVEGTFVVALLGQSNMVGRAVFDGGTVHPGGTMQLGRVAPNAGVAIPASVPLEHRDPGPAHVGLDIGFAQGWAAQNPGGTLILAPEAEGSTALGTGHWQKGGACYEGAVSRLNALMAANPDFVFAGFLWHQGEADAGNGAYAAQLDQMIADLRTDVTAATPESPFVLGQLAPGWVVGHADRQAVQDVLSDTPSRVGQTAVASSAGLSTLGDGVHFDAASLRTLGSRYASALPQAAAGAGQSILGPASPVAVGTIPDQTDPLDEGSQSGLAPATPQGSIPDQNDPVAALAPPAAAGSIPDQQDEVSA
ncbi:MAG: sialate O-acetylesterase [Pseudomonadota bacterium]